MHGKILLPIEVRFLNNLASGFWLVKRAWLGNQQVILVFSRDIDIARLVVVANTMLKKKHYGILPR